MRRKNTTSEMMKSYLSQSLLLLMERKALSDISIGEITAKAGVNRATYYRHFTSKEHIIKYYYTCVLSEYLNTLDRTGNIGLEQYLLGMFSHLKKYEKQLLLIFQNGVSHLIMDALYELFLQKQPRLSFHTEFAVHYHIGGIYGAFLMWFSHGMQESPAQLCQASMAVLPEHFFPILLKQ